MHTLHTGPSTPSDVALAALKVGDRIVSAYGGKGKINEVRKSDGATHFVVELDSWKLAQGQSPTQYLARDAIREVLAPEPVVAANPVAAPATA